MGSGKAARQQFHQQHKETESPAHFQYVTRIIHSSTPAQMQGNHATAPWTPAAPCESSLSLNVMCLYPREESWVCKLSARVILYTFLQFTCYVTLALPLQV